MLPAQSSHKAATPTELIAASLKGELIDVLRAEHEELKGLSRETAYEAVMMTPELLEACFKLFRTRPELFSNVVIGPDREPVRKEGGMLRCGRTLDEATTLIVQASAKRYFRRRGPLQKPRPKAKPNLWTQFKHWLSPPPPPKKALSPGEKLFRAIRLYLRFDWQAGMIPVYNQLSPETVGALGPLLLEIREPAQLRFMTSVEGMREIRGGNRPLLLDEAKPLITSGTVTLDPSNLWRIYHQMELARLFPGSNMEVARRATVTISLVPPKILVGLMKIFGKDIRLFAGFLYIAYTELGDTGFSACLGRHAPSAKAAELVTQEIAKIGLPPPSLDEMRSAFTPIINGLRPKKIAPSSLTG